MRKQNQTTDGFKLRDIKDLVKSLGAKIEPAKSHPEKIVFPKENEIPCALGPSTSFRDHVLPRLHDNFPEYSKKEIYQQLGRCYA